MMTTKSPAIASTFLASLLVAGSTANAANLGLPGPAFEREHPNGLLHRVHDAGQVVYELRAKGYHQIQVVDPYLPKIQVNACKDGTRWHLHANYYGDITHREWMGPCYRTRYGTRYGMRYGSQYRPWQERYGDY